MENTNSQNYKELPSTKKLILSTIIAACIATVILFTAILPAEYGIDPTGIGQLIGLKEMGEIKTSLRLEIQQEASREQNTQKQPIGEFETKYQLKKLVPKSKIDLLTFVLKPGETTEFKLQMLEGAIVEYNWTIDKGHVNYDNHGDSPTINYYGYKKGQKVQSDQGKLIAEFDGNHGWFWRNRSNQETIISLKITGEYQSFIQS